ncbi:hypothetical protein ILYODFUR_001931 [Ilyodon furcidens]|uniref:Uncharacterized protein n=1 Tax=Ilyodon furcidens TaxID=33524 RepID=A0ABV0UPR4_9TELE
MRPGNPNGSESVPGKFPSKAGNLKLVEEKLVWRSGLTLNYSRPILTLGCKEHCSKDMSPNAHFHPILFVQQGALQTWLKKPNTSAITQPAVCVLTELHHREHLKHLIIPPPDDYVAELRTSLTAGRAESLDCECLETKTDEKLWTSPWMEVGFKCLLHISPSPPPPPPCSHGAIVCLGFSLWLHISSEKLTLSKTRRRVHNVGTGNSDSFISSLWSNSLTHFLS